MKYDFEQVINAIEEYDRSGFPISPHNCRAAKPRKRFTREEIIELQEAAYRAWSLKDEDLRSLQDVVIDALIAGGVVEVGG